MTKKSAKYLSVIAATLSACSTTNPSFEIQELSSNQEGMIQYSHPNLGPLETQLYFEHEQVQEDPEQITVQAMNNAQVVYLRPNSEQQQYQGAFFLAREDVENPRLLFVSESWDEIPLELRTMGPSSWAAQVLNPVENRRQYRIARDLIDWAQGDENYSWFRACRTPDEIIQGTGEQIAATIIQFGLDYGGPIAVLSKTIEGYQEVVEALGILEFEEDINNCEGIYTAVIEPVDPRYRLSTGTLAFNTCVRELPEQEIDAPGGCSDLIDNDCDDLIDMQDPDCFEQDSDAREQQREEFSCELDDLLCDIFSEEQGVGAVNPPWNNQYGEQQHNGQGQYQLESNDQTNAYLSAEFQREATFRSSISLEHQGQTVFVKLIAQEGSPAYYLSTRFNPDGTGSITCWDDARIAAIREFNYSPGETIELEHLVDSHASFMTINEETFEFGARCFTDTRTAKIRFEQRAGQNGGRTNIDHVRVRARLDEF